MAPIPESFITSNNYERTDIEKDFLQRKIHEHPREFNAARQRHPDARLDLSDMFFYGINHTVMDFSNCCLDNSVFINCDLSHASFMSSSISNTVFLDCNLWNMCTLHASCEKQVLILMPTLHEDHAWTKINPTVKSLPENSMNGFTYKGVHCETALRIHKTINEKISSIHQTNNDTSSMDTFLENLMDDYIKLHSGESKEELPLPNDDFGHSPKTTKDLDYYSEQENYSNTIFLDLPGPTYSFNNCNFSNSIFINCDLSATIFKDCNLTNTVFRDCDLTNVKFRFSKFDNIISRIYFISHKDDTCKSKTSLGQVNVNKTKDMQEFVQYITLDPTPSLLNKEQIEYEVYQCSKELFKGDIQERILRTQWLGNIITHDKAVSLLENYHNILEEHDKTVYFDGDPGYFKCVEVPLVTNPDMKVKIKSANPEDFILPNNDHDEDQPSHTPRCLSEIIASGTVTTDKLAEDSMTIAKVADGRITTYEPPNESYTYVIQDDKGITLINKSEKEKNMKFDLISIESDIIHFRLPKPNISKQWSWFKKLSKMMIVISLCLTIILGITSFFVYVHNFDIIEYSLNSTVVEKSSEGQVQITALEATSLFRSYVLQEKQQTYVFFDGEVNVSHPYWVRLSDGVKFSAYDYEQIFFLLMAQKQSNKVENNIQ